MVDTQCSHDAVSNAAVSCAERWRNTILFYFIYDSGKDLHVIGVGPIGCDDVMMYGSETW